MGPRIIRAERKVPGGKLVQMADGSDGAIQLTGDFFLDPEEGLAGLEAFLSSLSGEERGPAAASGSPGSGGPGTPLLTAQKPHRRVHVIPRSMKAAWPWDQHSPLLGHWDDEHTVRMPWARISSRMRS